MSGATGQFVLGLDVAEPEWIPAAELRPGDVVQTRDHSGGKLWTSRVVEARVRWRTRRAAWPVAGVLLGYDRRVQVVTDRGPGVGLGRVVGTCRVEVVDRGPAAPVRPRLRVAPGWRRRRGAAGLGSS